jgi:hypothetical protein
MSFTKVVETGRFFFVYHAGSHQPEYVPKSAMTDAEISDLRDLFRNRLPAHAQWEAR